MPEPIIETRTPDQLPRATAISPDALITVQEESAPVVSIAVKALLGRLVQTDTAKETRADLLAELDHDAFAVGLVFADPDPAKNGWYRKVGASGGGTWSQFEKLSAYAAAEVGEYLSQASDAATQAAISAGIAEVVSGPSYLSQAAGEAATAPGDIFAVDPGTGVVSIYVRTGGGSTLLRQLATTAALASDLGSTMVGAPKPAGARDRKASDIFNDVVRLRDFHAGDGTNANVALASAIAEANARGVKRIVAGSGHYLLTNSALPAGMILEGDGESSRFTVGANNSNILLLNAADGVHVRGLRMEGDGTSTSSANGTGINMAASAGLVVEDVSFDGFGWGPMVAKNLSATRRLGPRIYRCSVRNTDPSGFADFFLTGAWDGIVLEDMDMICGSQRGLLLADEAGYTWRGASVRGGRFENFTWQAISCTDEGWDGTDRVFGFEVRGGYYKDIGSTAVKCKVSKGILIDGIVAENCGYAPENADAGLHGTILCNSLGTIKIVNCSLRASGTAGIVTNGSNPWPNGSHPGGFGMSSIHIAGNQVEGTGLDATDGAAHGNAIQHSGNCKSYIAESNQLRDIKRHGIIIQGVTSGPVQFVGLANNHMLDSPAAIGNGIVVQKAVEASFDGNRVFNWSGNCVVVEGCQSAIVGSRDRAGDSHNVGRCYTFTDCREVFFDGKAMCANPPARAPSTTYVQGDRVVLSGSDVVECIVGGTTAAGGAPALTGSPATAVDGGVTWGYVHKNRQNNAGIFFNGTAPTIAHIGPNARFDALVGPAVDGLGGSIPAALQWDRITRRTVTLAAGEATVTLTTQEAQFDANYKVLVTGDADETFRVPNADKATGAFKVVSSNGGSNAKAHVWAFR